MKANDRKSNTKVVKCTHCFKSVSIPSRMIIYNFLTKKDSATVGEIVDQVGLTQPTVSYHLKEMKHSGLLKNKKMGKKVFYSLRTKCPHLDEACILHGLKFPKT